jgi:uncharacterized damage-inducible protein DinB
MEYKKHFSLLLEYDFWANERISEVIKEHSLFRGKPIHLLSHIINAEVLILGRIRKEKFFDPFMVRSIEDNDELSKSIHKEWMDYIDSLKEDDFDNIVRYVNIRGEQVTAKIWEMIMHLINHSTYHRGQIATFIRGKNIEPPITDFMTFSTLKNKDNR